jgi:hypothetical protein
MKPERIFELAKKHEALNYPPGVWSFYENELMDFVVAILEEAHLEKAEREFGLDR